MDFVNKLLVSKHFLYLLVFLSAANLLGFLVAARTKPIIVFGLVGFIVHHFNKNMSVVLLSALLITNLCLATLSEGFDNKKGAVAIERAAATDPQIDKAIPVVASSSSGEDVKAKMKTGTIASAKATKAQSVVDTNNADLNQTTEETDAPEGFNTKKGSKQASSEHFGPRLDYAATIEQSYQNLDDLLGNDAIQKLTTDTQKLMKQQQNLFNTMNQMVPVLEGARSMLQGFDLNSLTQSLGNITGSATATAAKV